MSGIRSIFVLIQLELDQIVLDILNIAVTYTQHDDIQHNDPHHKGVLYVTLIITMICYCAECHILFIVLLNVIMQSVVAPSNLFYPTDSDKGNSFIILTLGVKVIKLFFSFLSCSKI
jgi:hypothetical protein